MNNSNPPRMSSPHASSKPHSNESSSTPGYGNASSCPVSGDDAQTTPSQQQGSSSPSSTFDQNTLNADLYEILKGFTSSSNGCDDDTMNAELLAIVQGFTAIRSPAKKTSPSSPSSADDVPVGSKPPEMKRQSLLGYCGIEQFENLPRIWSELQRPPPAQDDDNPMLPSCFRRRTLLLLARHFAKARKQDSRIQFFPKLQVAQDIQEHQFWHVGFDVDSMCRGMTPFAFVQSNIINKSNKDNGAESVLSIATGDLFMSILATYLAAICILFGTHCPLYAPLKDLLECFSTNIEAIRAVGLSYPEWYTKALLLICQESRSFFMVERRSGAATACTSILQATDFLKLCITTTGPNVIPNSLELLPTLQKKGEVSLSDTTTDQNIALSKKRQPQPVRMDGGDSQSLKRWKAYMGDEGSEDYPMEDAPSSLSSSSSLQPTSTAHSSQGDTLNTTVTSNAASNKRQALPPRHIIKRSKTTKEDSNSKRRFTESPLSIPNSKRPRNSHYMDYDDPDL